jgi:hypothetical protein
LLGNEDELDSFWISGKLEFSDQCESIHSAGFEVA